MAPVFEVLKQVEFTEERNVVHDHALYTVNYKILFTDKVRQLIFSGSYF